ncbi:MAG: hypothetical protein HY996_03495 [Micrococcales bacterium]|nr:hypothetical protein [Micrococcales bacterium]
MRGALLLVVGIAVGFAVAHVVSRTPQGRALLDDLDARVQDFGAAVADGYRAREAELRDTVA